MAATELALGVRHAVPKQKFRTAFATRCGINAYLFKKTPIARTAICG